MEQLRDIHRRLHYFSFVVPRPKEAEGDSLQVQFTFRDADDLRDLLSTMGITSLYGYNDETRTVEDAARRSGHYALGDLDVDGNTEVISIALGEVVLALHNDDDVFEVDEKLVLRAEQIEKEFDRRWLRDWPRSTGTSFLTPERHPRFFGNERVLRWSGL